MSGWTHSLMADLRSPAGPGGPGRFRNAGVLGMPHDMKLIKAGMHPHAPASKHRDTLQHKRVAAPLGPQIDVVETGLRGFTGEKITREDWDKAASDDSKHYGLFSWQYLKLAKAYELDKEAALMSCSWGKFQIMGEAFSACGKRSAREFVLAMCVSEREHLAALVGFCNTNIAAFYQEFKDAAKAK